MAGYCVQHLLGYRIGVLLARRDRRETSLPVRTRGDGIEAALHAVFDNCSDLSASAVGPPLMPGAAALEVGAVGRDTVYELNHALALGRDRLDNRRRPLAGIAKLQHRPQLGDQPVGAREISLV